MWKQTTTENIMLLFFAVLLSQAVQQAQPFTHRDYLINKFVWHPVPGRCLLWAWPVVTGCSLPPSVTTQAAFCALGWRPHWWLSWPEARASKPPASYGTGCLTRRVNTAALKYSDQKCISEFRRCRSQHADAEDSYSVIISSFFIIVLIFLFLSEWIIQVFFDNGREKM